MTLMGQKRKASSGRPRKPAVKRTPSKATHDKAEAYEAFMDKFRGLPSWVSGRKKSQFLRNEKGELLLTEGHHILHRSTHPEYTLVKENIAIMTREEHGWAEQKENEFIAWLKEHRPEAWEWREKHNNHRSNATNEPPRLGKDSDER